MTSPASETAAPTVLEIHGGTLLAGATVVDGSKNAALPLLVATHLEGRHPVTPYPARGDWPVPVREALRGVLLSEVAGRREEAALILTGPEITAAVFDGRVRISPFSPDQVNPNRYDVRLGPPWWSTPAT